MPKIEVNVIVDKVQPIKKEKMIQMHIKEENDAKKEYTYIKKSIYVDFPEPKKYKLSQISTCDCESDEEYCCRNGCVLKVLDIECDCRAHGGKDCGNQRIQRRQFAKTVVQDAGLKGRGLFAAAPIKIGQLICDYVGEIISDKTCQERLSQKHFYAMYVEKGMYIDASQYGNEARFLNHSCDPNAEARPVIIQEHKRVGIFAIKNISKGEEICFNYRFENWSEDKTRCYCGSANCTGYMDGSK